MKFYKTDWFLRLVSILAAIIIWFYVVYQENPTIDVWVSNIPLAQRNLPKDFENGKLVIMEMSTADVDVKISGRRRLMSSVKADSGEAYIDMSKITEEGTYEMPINVNFPIDGIDVVQLRKNRCRVVVDRVVTEEREIAINREGVVAEGHSVDNIVATPTTIKLSGPKSTIANISSCSITVDLTGKSEDFKGLYKVKLYDNNNVEVTKTSIVKNIEYADVYTSISAVKNVPVIPSLSADVNSKGEKVTASCEPSKITIKGKTVDFNTTEQLLTGIINVSGILESTEIEQEILLPDGMSFVDEENKKVIIKLTVHKNITE